jgi:hypothetical protein
MQPGRHLRIPRVSSSPWRRTEEASEQGQIPATTTVALPDRLVVPGSIQPSGSSGLFEFYVVPGGGGALLKQMQVLPPGTYRLRRHSRGIEQERGALPYWSLLCGSRELGRIEVPNSAEAGGSFTGVLSVPAGCPVQTLVLIGRPSESVAGLMGQIDRLELKAAQ